MAVQEDKRVRRTKKILREALVSLLKRKDLQSITVTDIVREADINRGTFYAYYRDVYDLHEKIENEMIQDIKSILPAPAPSLDKSALQQTIDRVIEYNEENKELVSTFMRTNGPDTFRSKLIEMMENSRREATNTWDFAEAYTARFISAGVIGMLDKWITEDAHIQKEEMGALITYLAAIIR